MVKLTKTDKIQQKAEIAAKEKTEKNETPKTKETKKEKTHATIADLEVILYPLVTEKAVNMIDAENKITFIVANNTDKKKVKEVIERIYEVKVAKINMVRDMKGRKKAIVRLKKEFKAGDLATKLKVL